MKIIWSLLASLLALALTYKEVRAAYLTLSRIGTISTGGQVYSSWTYTAPTAPDFAGAATPGAVVAVTVNAQTSTVSAAANGSWSSIPANIVTGTNSVLITSGN